MDDEYELVVNTNKPWHSTYDKQKAPDVQANLKKVLKNKKYPTGKPARYFTTESPKPIVLEEDTTEQQISKNINVKRRFGSKND